MGLPAEAGWRGMMRTRPFADLPDDARALAAPDIGWAQFRRQQVIAAEDIERQVTKQS
jgi:hypothetical protein